MQRVIINKLGPIDHCEFEVNDFMIFVGPQASGKSTIAKTVFFFKNVKQLLLQQINKGFYEKIEGEEFSHRKRLIKQMRSIFLQTFGSTWHMDKNMSMEYYYSEHVSIRIYLKDDPINPNYIWIELSDELGLFLSGLMKLSNDDLMLTLNNGHLKNELDRLFDDDSEAVYIPAGRSMMTLFSSQLMYMYGIMSDDQKRSLDYCTQIYLERIMQLKPFFANSIQLLIKNKIDLTNEKVNVKTLKLCESLIKQILQGEYRNVDGEERLMVSPDHYVKINFASSGQQEAVWILNVVFYYLLNHNKAYFIIEEPESHLFPNAQKLIAEFISVARNDGNKILVTTHSPYILGAFNNLLYANKISEEVDRDALSSIICSEKWLRFDGLSAFYVEQGNIQSCCDDEFRAIRNEVIDGASNDINDDFDRMLVLKGELGGED